MQILQILPPDSGAYERRLQELDAGELAGRHRLATSPAGANGRPAIAHLYGNPESAAPMLRTLGIPYVASTAVSRRRFSLRPLPAPVAVVSPLRETGGRFIPEAVADAWFEAGSHRPRRDAASRRQIGSYARPGVVPFVEQTMTRIHRFRDDVDWQLFERPPLPAEMAALDAWVDPALDESDFEGMAPEAIAAGTIVVASRTPINAQRLERGHCGLLVPPGDPNELTHAILTALFKPEVADARSAAARQTSSRFRSRQRIRALEQLYETFAR